MEGRRDRKVAKGGAAMIDMGGVRIDVEAEARKALLEAQQALSRLPQQGNTARKERKGAAADQHV